MSSEHLFAVNLISAKTLLASEGYRPNLGGQHGPTGWAWTVHKNGGKDVGSVIVSQAEHESEEWLHASIAWRAAMPSYRDLVVLHRAIFGRKRWAYQAFAPDVNHINIHAYALHLWGRADGKPVLPDFGAMFGSI